MATRLEKVVLDLEDRFTRPMAQATAATLGLDAALKRLDGSSARVSKSTSGLERDVAKTASTVDRGGAAIDRYSGRLSLLAEAVAVLGPGLIPIGAVGVPAVTGLAAGLAAAAVGGGSLMTAMIGVGDAIKAVDAWQLDPTVENLEKAREAMQKIGPDARNFVREWQAFQPVLTDLQRAAASGWFPGLIESLDSFEKIAPRVADLLDQVGRAGGEAIADGAESLTTDRWTPFLDFLTSELPGAITNLAGIVGDLAHGVSEMWQAFDPANDQFLDWLGDVADGFDDWASSASGREDISAFLAYVAQTGPQVEELFLSLVNALTQITQAAAPLGGPVLTSLTAIADVIAAIADSDLGTPIFAMISALSILNRALAVTKGLQASALGSSLFGGAAGAAGAAAGGGGGVLESVGGFFSDNVEDFKEAASAAKENISSIGAVMGTAGTRTERESNRMRTSMRGLATNAGKMGAAVGKAAAPMAGMMLMTSGVAKNTGLANTASLTLMGTMLGPWGAVMGGAAGFALDFAKANDEVTDSLTAASAALDAGSLAGYASSLEAVQGQIDDLAISGLRLSTMGDVIGGGVGEALSFLGGNSEDAAAEAVAQREQLEAQAKATQDAAVGLAKAFDMNIGPVDGSAASYRELDSVLQSAQPAMDRLRYSTGDLANAQAVADGSATYLQTALASLNPTYDVMVDNIARATAGTDTYSRTSLGLKNSLKEETAALQASIQALKDKHQVLLGAFNAETQYRRALKDAEKLGRKNNAGIKGDKEAALKNRDALAALASAWNDQSNAVKNSVPRWKAARDQFIDVATAMGVPEARAKRLAHQVMDIPRSVAIKTDADTAGAMAKIRSLSAQLDAATRARTARVNIQYNDPRRAGGSTAAGGGTVPKTGLGYADRHHYLLADGEEVTSNRHGQADAYRPVLKAINANLPRSAIKAMLAEGGTAGYLQGLAAGGTTGDTFYNDNTRDYGTGNAGSVARATARALRMLNHELDKATDGLNKETAARQAVISAVKSNFLTDPFAQSEASSNMWAAGATAGGISDPLAALRASTRDANKYKQQITKLRAMGLDGAALGEVDTLAEAQALTSRGRGYVRQYEKAYGNRAAAVRGAGATLADGVGATVAELQVLQAEVKGLRADVRTADRENRKAQDLNAEKVGHVVNGAGNKGKRDSKGRRDRD